MQDEIGKIMPKFQDKNRWEIVKYPPAQDEVRNVEIDDQGNKRCIFDPLEDTYRGRMLCKFDPDHNGKRKITLWIENKQYHEILGIMSRRKTRHRNEDGSIGTNSKCRAHLYNAAKNGPAKSEFTSTLSSLLLCCKAASDVAAAAYQRRKADSPMSLRGLRHEIDARRDLLMPQQGWQSQCHRLATSVRYMEPQRTLHNLAVVWPGPDTQEFYGFNALMNLLSLWENLHALYVVVDPGYLEAKPWRPDEDRCWDNDHDGCLSTFLDTCRLDESRHEPSVFYHGDRVCYEVGVDVLAKAGGLGQVAELLFVAQKELNETYQDEEEEPVKVHDSIMEAYVTIILEFIRVCKL